MRATPCTLAAAALLLAALPLTASADRSVGAYPVVHDDYPASEVVLPIGEDVVLTVTGEARVRFEWVENAVDFSDEGCDACDPDDFDDGYSFWPGKINLGFRVDLPRGVAAVVELQGAFDLGTGTESRARQGQFLRPGVVPATFTGSTSPTELSRALGASGGGPSSLWSGPARSAADGVDDMRLHQGYIEAADILRTNKVAFSARFGRQELAYGTELLLGNQDFYDGQTYDALKAIFEFGDDARLDVFWAKLVETDVWGDASDDDTDLYGVYFSKQALFGSKVGFDAYAIGLDSNADAVWHVVTDPSTRAASTWLEAASETALLESYWVGARVFREVPHGWHWSAELVYQFGNVESVVSTDGGLTSSRSDADLSAWAFEGFMGFTWDTPSSPTVKWGLTWASGSDFDDLAHGDTRTFFTPAGEVHPRLGLMDLVDASNVHAYTLGYAGARGNHAWGVDLWYFELDEVDPVLDSAVLGALLVARKGEGLDEELGREIDVWYNYQYSKHLVAQFAVGMFDAGDFIEQVNDCATGDCDETLRPTDSAWAVPTDDAWRLYANLLLRF